jgi:hypothetical protein
LIVYPCTASNIWGWSYPSNSQVDVDGFRVPQWGMGECLLQTVRDIVCSCNIYKSITPKLLLLIIIDSSINSCQHNPHRKIYTKLEPSIRNTMCPLSANFLFFYWLSRSLVSLLPFRWASFCFKASMYLPIYKHKPISQKLCRMLKTLLYLREDPPTQTVTSWQCIYHEDNSIFKSHKWRHVSILQCQSL